MIGIFAPRVRTCGPRSVLVAMDPCGGSYVRECRCGWPSRTFPTFDAAQAAYDTHIAEARR